MAERELSNDTVSLAIGEGYTVTASGLTGRINASEGGTPGARALAADSFDLLLSAAGLVHDKSIAVTPAVSAERALEPGAAASLTIDVPNPPGVAALVLVEDESGAVSWVLPEGHDPADPASFTRALSGSSRFVIPMRGPSAETGFAARGLGDIGKKLLKVFLYPITDAVLGPIVKGFASAWERRHRPYLARTYTPENYKDDRRDFPALTAAEWQRLGGGPALLFVHGTFSSCGAFSPIAPEVMRELSDRYQGRVFAFNHPTMSADPRENALELLRAIPPGVKLEVDIVCHSRGGLVSRELAVLGAAPGGNAGSMHVRQIVLVAVPNAGTALTDDDHMTAMIDRFTSVAKLVPSASVQTIVESVVLALKVLAHGFLHDLTGLRAMNPRGPFLQQLNVPAGSGPRLFAIASNFEPPPGTPWVSVARAEDAALDTVFAQAPNDLVVPTEGVYAGNGGAGFPIVEANIHRFGPADGVIHTEFFSRTATQDRLLDWLMPDAAPRALSAGAGIDQERMARLIDSVRELAFDLQSTQSGTRNGRTARAPSLSPEQLTELRPHVVDLREGKFRASGRYFTPPADVEAIFSRHIPAWRATRPAGEPLRLVFFAHGGLVAEEAGLGIARKHVQWWKDNGVYPIYFVWETGLFDALGTILRSVAARAPATMARDFTDVTDRLVQEAVRAIGGGKIWSAMKSNAQLASAEDGGARYVAGALKRFCDVTPGVQLHAVGHSAGSIFHAHFIPTALSLGAPRFTTLQLLAPAIRVDEFKKRLASQIGAGAGALAAFAMHREVELADDCIGVYRKSLLYLIYYALEQERATPILGLETSIAADDELRALFGLGRPEQKKGDLILSVTDASNGKSASRSKHHGDFDDDAATMTSVAARVLNVDAPPVPYAGTIGRQLYSMAMPDWLDALDWSDLNGALPLPDMSLPAMALPSTPTPDIVVAAPPPSSSPPVEAPKPAPTAADKPSPISVTDSTTKSGGGRKVALCIGIDEYPAPNGLHGCVADTRAWGDVLGRLGYDVRFLHNAAATYEEIKRQLGDLVASAKAGDHLIFQYSGHGTEVPDVDGDEGGGPDQAMVPIDFDSGAFLIDDDIRTILLRLPSGVEMTCFIDCCHSATITRVLGRTPPPPSEMSLVRFIRPTPEQIARHRRFREDTRRRALGRDLVDRTVLRWVNFSACQKGELAIETNGSGDFTRLSTKLMHAAVTEHVNNREFQRRVVREFGDVRRQTPYLDCPLAAEDAPLFGFVSAEPVVAGGVKAPAASSALGSRLVGLGPSLPMPAAETAGVP
jgi:pimeloyl-ACP methyl ester carboxylesterase